jgi:hypothetical protein
LPDDWKPSPELVAWVRSDYPNVDGRLETENFRDYWHSKAGKDATKTSWDLTFRRWIRNSNTQAKPRAIHPTRRGEAVNGERGWEE